MTARRIELAHGGGGARTAEWIREEILPRFGAGPLAALPDAARLPAPPGDLVFSTDSFVVSPPVFRGGNIGHLAVHGTVNDLAAAGGRPLWLSLALVLEEGLDRDLLATVLDAIRDAAAECGAGIVTGDTKVVARGQCDQLYITTAGIGAAWPELSPGADRVRPGDAILTSGPLGDHGMAVLCARHGLAPGSGPASDTAPVHRLVEALRPLGAAVRFLRDPTRGGAAAVWNELAEGRAFGVRIDEATLPVSPAARAVAEMLGADLLHSPSEGRLLLVCAPEAADAALAAWRARPEGRAAAVIGRVTARHPGCVVLDTAGGGQRLVDWPQGEVLPRIC